MTPDHFDAGGQVTHVHDPFSVVEEAIGMWRYKREGDWDRRVEEARAALDRLQAENERLREALQLIAAPKRPDGTYNRSREACEELARRALGGGE